MILPDPTVLLGSNVPCFGRVFVQKQKQKQKQTIGEGKGREVMVDAGFPEFILPHHPCG